MNSVQTPGPWEHYEERLDQGRDLPTIIFHTVRHTGGENIVRLHDAEKARLIAAAPDLLECLIRLKEQDWFKNNLSGQVACILDAEKVRNAIAKAEGAH